MCLVNQGQSKSIFLFLFHSVCAFVHTNLPKCIVEGPILNFTCSELKFSGFSFPLLHVWTMETRPHLNFNNFDSCVSCLCLFSKYLLRCNKNELPYHFRHMFWKSQASVFKNKEAWLINMNKPSFQCSTWDICGFNVWMAWLLRDTQSTQNSLTHFWGQYYSLIFPIT